MQPNQSLKAVLWDMDGVLVDTFDGHYLAWQQTMDELQQPFNLEMFTKTFGMNNHLILTTVFKRELDEDFIQQVSDRKEVLFRKSIKNSVKLLPGVEDWLIRFRDLGLKQAVASSAPQENITALLDEFAIGNYFGAEAAGATIQGKPDPAVFLLAASRLEVSPQDCLVIEDSVAGVEAARRGGMKCLAVLTTHSADKLTGADMVVKDLSCFSERMLARLFEGG